LGEWEGENRRGRNRRGRREDERMGKEEKKKINILMEYK
jgi:hypothetical protein